MANEFENLNLNINANDSASVILNNIITRLEKIQRLNGKVNPTVNIAGGDIITQSLKQSVTFSQKYTQSIKQNIKQTNKFVEANKRNNASLSDTAIRMGALIMLTNKLANFFSSAIQESGAYIENLNLFAVTFGKEYKETAKWALDLANNLGLANNEIIKFTGLFKQLSTAIGIADDTGTAMSKTLTQLGYDFASFYNIDITTAMEKLQAGIFSGQTKPLRSIGIDVTYQSIDNLLKTNEALAKFGTSSKKLDQSQKAIARLIIAMQSGSNAFGDMANTINTLSNQIRVLQGSFANFKFAVGDLIQKPIASALVYVNAFIIALTNFIRKISPINTTSKTGETQISQLGADSEEASEQLDSLSKKLASFDKFNALNTSEDKTNQAITEALTQELLKQQEEYESIVSAMDDVKNKSVELAKEIEPLAVVLGVTLIISIGSAIGSLKLLSLEFLKSRGIALSWGSVLKNLGNGVLIGGIVYSIVKAIDEFKKGNYWGGILATTIGVTLAGAFIYLNRTAILTLWQTLGKKLIPMIWYVYTSFGSLKAMLASVAVSAVSFGMAFGVAWSILSIVPKEHRKVVGGLMALAGAFIALTTAVLAYNTVISWGTALPILSGAIGIAIAGGVGWAGKIKDIQGFADGGYTNANLIMTHENGKREWVGKQAGSSAIVNDTQMSDIMEKAVARGVYSALLSNRASGGTNQSEVINISIDGEKVFTAVKNKASQKGYAFSKV